MQRRHERKKEKRKRSARLQLQVQEHSGVQSQTQPGATSQTENTHVSPQPIETALPQSEKPQKTVIKTQPKTPKARTSNRLSVSTLCAMITSHSHKMSMLLFRFRRSVTRQWSKRQASARSLWLGILCGQKWAPTPGGHAWSHPTHRWRSTLALTPEVQAREHREDHLQFF